MASPAKPDLASNLTEQLSALRPQSAPSAPVVIHLGAGATLNLVVTQPKP